MPSPETRSSRQRARRTDAATPAAGSVKATSTSPPTPARTRHDMDIKRTGVILKPNNARVLFRPFELMDPQRIMKIMARVMELSDADVDALMAGVMAEFHGRHHRLQQFFLARFEAFREHLI